MSICQNGCPCPDGECFLRHRENVAVYEVEYPVQVERLPGSPAQYVALADYEALEVKLAEMEKKAAIPQKARPHTEVCAAWDDECCSCGANP